MRRAGNESNPHDSINDSPSIRLWPSLLQLPYISPRGWTPDALFEKEAYRRPGVLRRLFATHAITATAKFPTADLVTDLSLRVRRDGQTEAAKVPAFASDRLPISSRSFRHEKRWFTNVHDF